MSTSQRATAAMVREMPESERPITQANGFHVSTQKRIVTDDDVDRALAFLRDSAIAIGAAREDMVNASNYIKHVEALLYLSSDAKTVDAKKAEVKCKQRWLDAGTAEAKAAGEFEKLKALREAASAKIDAWRSESANYRGMRV